MGKEVIFLLGFLLTMPLAYSQWYFDSENIEANIRMAGEAEIIPLAASHYTDYVIVNMTFFPQQFEGQEVINFEANPDAVSEGNTLKFRWDKPDDQKLVFSLNADVKTSNRIIEVREKIKFPIEEFPEELAEYTKPSKTINSDDEEIIKKASEIVEGDDDLYSAVYKLADWTKNNINYNLSTLTVKASQNASWVLQNRQGVCDELTSLFIAMLRSLRIPSKFVSGIAYTNSPLFEEGWGPHGWAEVYFPGYGWMPYDVTYGEFGFVDPTHFKFKESIDPDESSTFYFWQGKNVNLHTKKLDIKTKLENHGTLISPKVSIKANAVKDKIGFGSFNLIEAEVNNLNDYYYSTELFLSKPDEVELIGSRSQSVLLYPKESKKLYWILKVKGELDKNSIYTMPILINTFNNISSEAEFKTSSREIVYSQEEIESLISQKEEEKQKAYSAEILLECNASKSEFYTYENESIQCRIRNLGNLYLEDLQICYRDDCSIESIGISQEKEFAFDIHEAPEKHELVVTAKNGLVSKSEFVEIEVLDEPKISIQKIEIPENVDYRENFKFIFKLKKESYSEPQDIVVKFFQNGHSRQFSMSKLIKDKEFKLGIEAKRLKSGKNEFKIIAEYKDNNGRSYSSEETFEVNLVNLSLGQKTKVFFYQLGLAIAYLDIKSLLILFAIAAASFLITLWYTFRPKKEKNPEETEEELNFYSFFYFYF